jgi:DNA-binding response OmpR family regulator
MSSPFESALLVEDEPNLAIALQIALRKLGIPSRHASTLQEAKAKFSEKRPDLLILDRSLPDGDGFDFCAAVRKSGFEGVILILTAAAQISDRVKGLDQGADDYLPKPFSWEELEARVRALSRRRAPAQGLSSSAIPKTWEIDEKRLRIQGPRGWVELTPLEFKLAAKLILSAGSIVSRDSLLKDVWGFTLLPKTRTVDLFVGRLRKSFEADPEQPKHFLTVRGAGYRFEP